MMRLKWFQKTWRVTPHTTGRHFWWEVVAPQLKVPHSELFDHGATECHYYQRTYTRNLITKSSKCRTFDHATEKDSKKPQLMACEKIKLSYFKFFFLNFCSNILKLSKCEYSCLFACTAAFKCWFGQAAAAVCALHFLLKQQTSCLWLPQNTFDSLYWA